MKSEQSQLRKLQLAKKKICDVTTQTNKIDATISQSTQTFQVNKTFHSIETQFETRSKVDTATSPKQHKGELLSSVMI